MDEMEEPMNVPSLGHHAVHVLHVNLVAADGQNLHLARQVDTPHHAHAIAGSGHALDEVDGGHTVYTLCTWVVQANRADLESTVVLD
jgi:hypothetical protein